MQNLGNKNIGQFNNIDNDYVASFIRNPENHIVLTVGHTKKLSFIERLISGIGFIFGKEQKVVFDLSNLSEVKTLIAAATYIQTSKSNMIAHAIKEFEIAGWNNDRLQSLMCKQVIELIAVFSTHGHSGGSNPYAINLFNKITKFKIISPLTFKDDEFRDITLLEDKKPWFQNIRDGRVFKDDKGISYNDAFAAKVKSSKFFNQENIVKNNGGTYHCSVFESRLGKATGRKFRKCYFKQEDIEKGITPKDPIILPITEVEVKSENWLFFVDYNSNQLKELKNSYDIDWIEVPEIKGLDIIKLTKSDY